VRLRSDDHDAKEGAGEVGQNGQLLKMRCANACGSGCKRSPRNSSTSNGPAAVRFVSFEPLLEDLGDVDLTGIDWAIIGGESGPGARPMAIDWARALVEQCAATGTACFVKQLGANARVGPFQLAHNSRKGGDPSEWPEDLRVREWPA